MKIFYSIESPFLKVYLRPTNQAGHYIIVDILPLNHWFFSCQFLFCFTTYLWPVHNDRQASKYGWLAFIRLKASAARLAKEDFVGGFDVTRFNSCTMSNRPLLPQLKNIFCRHNCFKIKAFWTKSISKKITLQESGFLNDRVRRRMIFLFSSRRSLSLLIALTATNSWMPAEED